jgi:CubicO group peptidase (beta-lactamase class C family)
MNFPAASDGLSIGSFYRPKGRGIKPSSAVGGLKSASIFIILILSLISCRSLLPITNQDGLSQKDYQYSTPDKIDDGWQTGSLIESKVDSGKIVKLIKNILAGEYPYTHSVLLVKNGKLILEEYFYGYGRDDLHYLASATKSITSILVGISLDQGMIKNLDHNVYQLFPDYQGTEWISKKYKITLRHLLTMTSGIEWDENRSRRDPRHDYYAMRRGGDWIRYVFNKELVAPPGQKFNYNGGLSALLGEIIKRTSGLNAKDYSKKYLFDPLGISHYRWFIYNGGSINTGGGLLLRSRDMAKIGQVMLENGRYNGKQILSENWIAESTENRIAPDSHPLGSGYGYQWWIGETSINGRTIEVYYAQGMGGQFIFVVPEMKITTVITSQLHDNPGGQFRSQAMMTEYIIPALLPPVPPHEEITLDQNALKNYVGDYEFKRWGYKLSITTKDNQIIISPSGLEEAELIPISETEFRGDLKYIGNIKVDFSKDDKGIINYLTMRVGFSNLKFDKTN